MLPKEIIIMRHAHEKLMIKLWVEEGKKEGFKVIRENKYNEFINSNDIYILFCDKKIFNYDFFNDLYNDLHVIEIHYYDKKENDFCITKFNLFRGGE